MAQHGRLDISSRYPPSGGERRLGPLVTLVRSGQNRCPTANHQEPVRPCPAPARKIFRLTRRANQRYQLAPSHPTRGALRTSRHARWDAVDAELAKDERKRSRTAKSCGPGAPTLALSSQDASASCE